jgi:hypothetical protein
MSLKKNEELSEKDCPVYENYVHAEVCAQIERELNASKAEVERLKLLLSDLLILTEKNYWNSSNYNQIKEAINPTDK